MESRITLVTNAREFAGPPAVAHCRPQVFASPHMTWDSPIRARVRATNERSPVSARWQNRNPKR
jgi:hypothetical protein